MVAILSEWWSMPTTAEIFLCYRDNSEFPDTIVHYTKYTGLSVHAQRNFRIDNNQITYTTLYHSNQDDYCY